MALIPRLRDEKYLGNAVHGDDAAMPTQQAVLAVT
jgi:hypothetical protein